MILDMIGWFNQSACSVMPKQYVVLAFRRLPCIFLDKYMYILYIYPHAWESQILWYMLCGARFTRPINVFPVVNHLNNFKYINGVNSGLIQNFLCYGMTGE